MATLQENEARLLEIREKLLSGEDVSLEEIEALDKEINSLSEEREQLVAEEAKKAIMNNFEPEAWSLAAYSIAGKGEIDEDFAIREACLSDSVKFMCNDLIDRQAIKDYIEEVGTQMNSFQTLCTLYNEEGPEAIKPFFAENGLEKVINYYKENLIVRGGIIFLGDSMLRNALTA